MAREKDITRRPKFFVRKRSCDEDMLCERCRHHQYLIMVRYGCDALIYTDTKVKTVGQFIDAANSGRFVHLWCIHNDDPPSCIEQFREAGALR